MPELKEVFDMVTKQTEPELDSWKQEQRQRQAARNRRIGALALVAAIAAVAAVIAIQRDGSRRPGPHRGAPEPAGRRHPRGRRSSTPATSRRSRLLSTAGSATWCHRTVTSWPSLPPTVGDISRLHIYIGNVDGTGVRRVTPLSDGMDEFNPRWTPDGADRLPGSERSARRSAACTSWILSAARRRSSPTSRCCPPPLVRVGERAFRRPGGSCSTSPEGRWRIWSGTSGRSRRPAGNLELVLRHAAHGSYSPDGTTIVYVGGPRYEKESDAFAGTGIWLADADGKHPRLLVMASGEQEELGWPRWSPDGTRIAYAFESAVFVIDVDTGQIAKVLDGGEPDGSTITR